MKNIREFLAVMWSIAAMIMLGYVLVMHGDQVEILTLIIGTLTGTIIVFGLGEGWLPLNLIRRTND